MTTTPGSSGGAEHANPSLRVVAEQVVPDLDVVSVSNPEPVLRRFNVVAVAPTTERARKAVVDLEGLEADDASIGVVVFGSEATSPADGRVDPEGVTGAVFPRIVVGGLIGLIVGGILVGLGAYLFGAESAAIGAAVGGAAMGFVFGAIWVVFARLGGSDAYRQTFVRGMRDDVTLVSLHTDDAAEAAKARERLAGGDLKVYEVSPSGDVSAA
jgi:hypothetical protein